MKLSENFPVQIAMASAGAVALLAYPLTVYAPGEVLTAVTAGAALSTVNVMLGYAAIRYSFDKSYTTFLKAVLGGMGLRMVFMLGILIALILIAHLQAVALTVSMLGFYFMYLILEILFIQRKMSAKNEK